MNQRVRLNGTIPTEFAGSRLDQALARMFPQYSRSRIQHWIRTGCASVDGSPCRPRDAVGGGESVAIEAELEPETRWTPEAIVLNIVHEDPEILVINKPAGLVVHPGAGNKRGTLLNALLHHAPALAAVPRAGIVHRLDKDTSGLMVVAKTLSAHKRLVAQLAAREINREYEALVLGALISGGRIDGPVGRHPTRRTRMAVTGRGRDAVTHVRVIERLPGLTHLGARLETGRTHQIRVHLAHRGHPVVGDRGYGGYGKRVAGMPAALADAV
ncbi:MAG: 23S rRNA pseudouridine(1911/1915/1917) synthase RluD, partial [Gammaproteobacteria bacterium]|nr:23S rRNA pseudouridine(1911/1915/1917) synthase RluD [Gammaproteobacteria bacterium]